MELVSEPWRHLEIHNALKDPQGALEAWPLDGWNKGRLYRKYRRIGPGLLLDELSQLGSDWCNRLGVDAEELYRVALFVDDEAGYRIRPHTDIAEKVISGQIYLAEDSDHEDYGALLLGDVPRQMPYRLNFGYAFARSEHTWHEVKACDGPRKSIQLIYYATPNPVL